MGIYTRYKRSPDGFRTLVELLEVTPADRRKKMVDAGMAEDLTYTQHALAYMLTFADIIALPEMELAEVVAAAPCRMTAYAIALSSQEVKDRFIKCAKPQMAAEIRDLMESKIGPREVGGAQIKLIETARQLERRGLVKTKRIPT